MSKEQPASSQVPVIADGMTLGVIGAGVMGQTLIRGLLNSGLIAARAPLGGRQERRRLRERQPGTRNPGRNAISRPACPPRT